MDDSSISENVSKKRGRPKKLDPALIKIAESAFDGRSNRGLQNRAYTILALAALSKDIPTDANPYGRLLPSHQDIMTGKARYSKVLMSHLGRLEDADTIRSVMRQCCDLNITPKEAIEAVKRYRRTGKKPFDSGGFYKRIVDVINSYAETHECTIDDFARVLKTISENISRNSTEDETQHG